MLVAGICVSGVTRPRLGFPRTRTITGISVQSDRECSTVMKSYAGGYEQLLQQQKFQLILIRCVI